MSRFYKACLKEQYQNEQTIELINTAFINEFQAPKVKVDNFEIPIINNIQYLQWELDNMKENPLTAPKHWSVAKLRKATWKTLSDELQFKGYGYGESINFCTSNDLKDSNILIIRCITLAKMTKSKKYSQFFRCPNNSHKNSFEIVDSFLKEYLNHENQRIYS